ncbi:MAG: DNA polymerase III subunit delta [Thermodesulfovibrionales bacterium]|nr:DNA polymerase III subunit delta [Thermodesulfovibrionales bacterium]
MSIKAFDKELTKGFKEPIYAVISNDDFLLNDAMKRIKKDVVFDEFNFEEFDLSDNKVPLGGIMESLNMIPFMSGRKVVFIRHSEKLTKKELSTLDVYFSNPSSFTLLILFFKVSDMRKPLSINSNVKTITLSLSDRELVDWIANKAISLGYELTREAIEYLINVSGTDAGIINAELLKFSTLNKAQLDIVDISNIIYAGADYGAFELIDLIKQGDLKKSLLLFQKLNESIETYQLLGALCWDLVVKQGREMDIKRMRETLKILHEADKLSKRGAFCVMETTIVKLIEMFDKGHKTNILK